MRWELGPWRREVETLLVEVEVELLRAIMGKRKESGKRKVRRRGMRAWVPIVVVMVVLVLVLLPGKADGMRKGVR